MNDCPAMILGSPRSLARRRSLLDNLTWLHSKRKDQGAVLRSQKKEGIPDEDQSVHPRPEQ
jgi:hypothetical protein